MTNPLKPSVHSPTRALREFLATEVAGGVVLVVAAVAALVWANGPFGDSYDSFWSTELAIELGSWGLHLDLHGWVNDGLMALFFLVVGLEVKREFLHGELRDPRRAALPVIAAVGGMVVPALLYVAVAASSGIDGVSQGWGVPMATDIAFALGVAALVARRLPSSLRLFLLTLAIVDDIGAIIVIAVFYSGGVDGRWLGAALAILTMVYALRQGGLTWTPMFVVLGSGLWLALHESGVHATLAGVAMGLLAPAEPTLDREIVIDRTDELLDVFSPEGARATSQLAKLSVSRLEWLEHGLHPWTSLLIVPLFALANAGVELSSSGVADAASSPITIGVIVGLVVGKPLGISLFAWLACRVGIASPPADATWRGLVGVGALAGIGFTVSLFVAGLAFDDGQRVDEATIGIFVASLAAAILGAVLLRGSGEPSPDHS